VVDPHWLSLMVRTINECAFDGCGGPNYAPHEDGWIEACVAASPGAPCHVLTGDDRAEHLAGCNMVFRKAALLKVGGFDRQFNAAGDDVDICWRLIDAGFVLGFCPAAFVWHFRRNSVGAYYGQQRGYGRAEAMLYLKYPERFNAIGQIKWRGTIPGLARMVPGGSRTRVARRRGPVDLQRVREVPLSVLKTLPITFEWNLAAVVVLLGSLAFGFTVLPALGMLTIGPLWALYYASRASIEKCHDRVASRMLVAALAYTGPLARAIARYRHRQVLRGKAVFDRPPRQRPMIDWARRTIRLSYWNETWTTRDRMLEHLGKFFAGIGHPARLDSGWNDFDLVVEPDAWTRIQFRSADEEHGGTRLKNHVAARVRLSTTVHAALMLCVGTAVATTGLGFAAIGSTLAVVSVGVAILAMSEAVETGRLAYRAVEQCASELKLIPLGAPRAAALRSIAGAEVAVKAETSAEAAQPAGR
jgi:O-antigen biosynthesis protein